MADSCDICAGTGTDYLGRPCRRCRSSAVQAVTVPPVAYHALLRLAAVHKRAVCDCENCPSDKAFAYDNCECGEDWSTCEDDVDLLDRYVPLWRGSDVHDYR